MAYGPPYGFYANHSYKDVNIFRMTKDIQFDRTRSYNLPDLLANIMDNSDHYISKCLDIANGRNKSPKKSKYDRIPSYCEKDDIMMLGNDCYLVPSETYKNLSYTVDMGLR